MGIIPSDRKSSTGSPWAKTNVVVHKKINNVLIVCIAYI
jgi:hypothetical protein